MTSASWQHKMSLIFCSLPQQQNVATILRQKSLWGNYWIQHHILRGQEDSSLPGHQVIGWQTSVPPGNPEVAHEPAPASIVRQSRNPWRTLTWTIPHRWENIHGSIGFQGDIPALSWAKKYQQQINKQKPSLDTLEEIRGTVWQKLGHHLPRYDSLGSRKFFLNPVIYPVKEKESIGVSTQVPQLCGSFQRSSLLSCSS